MKRRFQKIISIGLAVVLTVTMSVSASFGAEVKRPDVGASGAIVYCQNTGEIIYSKNKEKKLDPHSVTKLMTVMLAVQNLPMDKEVTISKKASGQPGASMKLKEGEIVTVKDLIYGAMLKSGNDAAYALGEAVSGDMKTFVRLMNKTASNIGCERTHFTNPSGLQAKKHYTTAKDLMLITKVALSNKQVREASGAKTYKVKKTNKSKARVLKTNNRFVADENSGVYAGKTGYGDEENCSIALGYRENGLHLYIILLGDKASEREKDVNTLIRYTQAKVEGVHVVGKDAEEGKVRIKHGAKTRLKVYTAEKGYAYLPKEASKSLIKTNVVVRNDVTAPVRAGEVVGKMEIYVADDLVNEVDLVVRENVEEGWFTSYIGISNLGAMIICAVILLIVLFRIWVYAMRAKYRKKKKAIRQRKIMEMAMAEMRREQDLKERDWRF